jgi:hypothetical protein
MPFSRRFAYLSSAGAVSASSQRLSSHVTRASRPASSPEDASHRSTHQEYQLTIRLVCASTVTAIGLACSSTAFARVVVYMPAAVIYAPPPRPVYYSVPVNPVYVVAPPPVPLPVAVPVAATVTAPKPVPLYTTVVVPAPTNYAIVPAPAVTYAQPVMMMPR